MSLLKRCLFVTIVLFFFICGKRMMRLSSCSLAAKVVYVCAQIHIPLCIWVFDIKTCINFNTAVLFTAIIGNSLNKNPSLQKESSIACGYDCMTWLIERFSGSDRIEIDFLQVEFIYMGACKPRLIHLCEWRSNIACARERGSALLE